ncbi:methyl-accepting chemotaxis protein [Clostridium thermarum]|uniref:methyl-accepting chemotaxis protein n=1 Tax=Clostridium thermarum TaxID=1716543 RepID=UPI0013D6A113|nr:methyl-accepting chemotaxis protein [Clostridium thermarum]
MKLSFKSIKVKLILSMLLLCIIPLVIVGVISYSQSKSILLEKLKVTSGQTLAEIESSLDNYFTGLGMQLKQVGNSEFINELDMYEQNIPYAIYTLKDIKDSNTDIVNTFYATEKGKYVNHAQLFTDTGVDYTKEEWYVKAANDKKNTIIMPPHIDSVTKKAVVKVVRGVQHNSKTNENLAKVAGVIGMDMSLEGISKVFSKSKVGDSGYIIITSGNGTVISHRDSSVIGSDLSSSLNIWDKVVANDEGFEKFSLDGNNSFAVYHTHEMTGWKVIAVLDESELNKDVNHIKNIIFLVILAVTVVAVLLSMIIGNSIGKNVRKLKDSFGMAAQGDLTAVADIKSKDELGQLGKDFIVMLAKISTIMKDVSASAETMLEASSQIGTMVQETTASVAEVSKAMMEVSEGSNRQAENAQESTRNIEKLSKKLDDITELTKEVEHISLDTEKLGEKGLEFMKVLTDRADKAKQSTINVNSIVNDVDMSISQINTISDSIAQITEQTNLLSLNASIEAARAGEAGKGFAVVADEIRKLAEKSRASTVQIQKIIETIRSKSAFAVEAIGSAESAINEQDKAMLETKQVFDEIINGVITLSDKIVNIKDSTVSIDESKDIVVQQIHNISAISQETASVTEEVSASTEQVSATMQELTSHAEQLQKLATKLQEEVGKFKVN